MYQVLYILLFLPSTPSVMASVVDEHHEILVYCTPLVTALTSQGIIFCLHPGLPPCRDPQLILRVEHAPCFSWPQSPAPSELPSPQLQREEKGLPGALSSISSSPYYVLSQGQPIHKMIDNLQILPFRSKPVCRLGFGIRVTQLKQNNVPKAWLIWFENFDICDTKNLVQFAKFYAQSISFALFYLS